MSHINFDFLTESFLFGYGLEDNFSALSDYELEKELKSNKSRNAFDNQIPFWALCLQNACSLRKMQRINKRGADKAPYFFALCMSI